MIIYIQDILYYYIWIQQHGILQLENVNTAS